MIFEWFNTSEVDALADRLAADLLKRVPPANLGERRGKKSGAKPDKAQDAVMRQAREFAGKHRLNVFKKARLANRFKWALIEAGYPKDFVNEMAFELASVIASSPKVSA